MGLLRELVHHDLIEGERRHLVISLARSGDHKGALQLFHALPEAGRADPELLQAAARSSQHLAREERKRGRKEQAQRLHEDAVGLLRLGIALGGPPWRQAWLSSDLGWSLVHLGAPGSVARAAFEQALALLPDNDLLSEEVHRGLLAIQDRERSSGMAGRAR
jgi:ATP-dependent DNA helicase RecG